MKQIKRTLVESFLTYSGAMWLRWRCLRQGLYCFNFHRIGEASLCGFDRGVFSCSATNLEDIIRLLKARFEIVSLNALLTWHVARASARRPLALLTFDDGYRDHFDKAFPILRRHGVSAAFFVPTGFIGNKAVSWWDEIAWCVRNATSSKVRLPGTMEEVSLNSTIKDRAIASVLRAVEHRTDVPIAQSIAEVREQTRCPSRDAMMAEAPAFMSWSDVRALVTAGMDVGSHSHSHRILAHLPPEEQEHELVLSKRLIESKTGTEVIAVAYPVGGAGTFTGATLRLARRVGYLLGFEFGGGRLSLPLSAPLAIPRYSVYGSSVTLMLRVGFPQWFH